MKITIDVLPGNGIQKNIDALQRAIDGKSVCSDFVPLMDTMTILEGIKRELPHRAAQSWNDGKR